MGVAGGRGQKRKLEKDCHLAGARRVPTLHHELGDDAMEHCIVVVPLQIKWRALQDFQQLHSRRGSRRRWRGGA